MYVHTGKSKELGERSLFLDLLVHLRETIKVNMNEIESAKDPSDQFTSTNFPYDQVNLVQSSIMCIDTLTRALGKSSSWRAKVASLIKSTIYDSF